jgi:hypothetical protein
MSFSTHTLDPREMCHGQHMQDEAAAGGADKVCRFNAQLVEHADDIACLDGDRITLRLRVPVRQAAAAG